MVKKIFFLSYSSLKEAKFSAILVLWSCFGGLALYWTWFLSGNINQADQKFPSVSLVLYIFFIFNIFFDRNYAREMELLCILFLSFPEIKGSDQEKKTAMDRFYSFAMIHLKTLKLISQENISLLSAKGKKSRRGWRGKTWE